MTLTGELSINLFKRKKDKWRKAVRSKRRACNARTYKPHQEEKEGLQEVRDQSGTVAMLSGAAAE